MTLEAAWVRGRSRRPQVVMPSDLVAAIAARLHSDVEELLRRTGLPLDVLEE